jgi:predicted DNA-binding protein (MmcQ/YjbR family)
MFAAWSSHEGREAVTIKQTQLDQALLLEDEDGYFLPPYVGKHGWVGVYTDAVDWSLVEGLLEDGYRLTAPKRALKALDS